MSQLNQIVTGVVLLAIAAFCAAGFVATFEPPGWIGLRIGYALACALCIFGVAKLLFRKRPDV